MAMWNRRRSGLYTRRAELYKGVEFLGICAANGSATTFVFDTPDLGPPDPKREIVLVIYSRNGISAPRTLDASSNMSGVTLLRSATDQQLAGSSMTAAVVPFPLGRTGRLNLTFSGSVATFMAVGLYRTVNRAAFEQVDSDNDAQGSTTGSTSATADATTQKPGGYLVGVGSHANSNPNTVTGAEKVGEVVLSNGGTTGNLAFVLRPPANVQVTPTVTWSWSGVASFIVTSWSFDFAA